MVRGSKLAAFLCLSVCVWALVLYIGMPINKHLLADNHYLNTTAEKLQDEKQQIICTHAPQKSISEMKEIKEKEQGEVTERLEYAPEAPEPPPPLPFPDVETTKKNWSAHCSYPNYIPEHVQKEPWFPRFLYHLQRVDLSTSSVNRRSVNCARWWYATPQLTYDEKPHRMIGWKAPPSPPPTYVRPKCPFGQKNVPKTRCAEIYGKLWRALDERNILYFPRGGTEMGILRGSGYIKTDGDIDLFIDYPPKYLVKILQAVLTPKPYLSGPAWKVATETHWKNKGCPTVHMVFNDWAADEMQQDFGRPTHDDICECTMDGVKMACHKQTLRRTYIMYGPSWRIPLHAKGLDVPQRAKPYNVAGKLLKWTSKDGIIHEETLQDLDKTQKYGKIEMEMSLAHVNVLKNLIDYQKRTKDTKFI